jgi:hypothetical protein
MQAAFLFENPVFYSEGGGKTNKRDAYHEDHEGHEDREESRFRFSASVRLQDRETLRALRVLRALRE